MIKNGLKSYFKNLKYFFTPLGAFALGIVMGLSVFIPGCLAALSDLWKDVSEIATSAEVDFSNLKNCVVNAVTSLDWNNPLDALSNLLSKEWLTQTLNDCISALQADTAGITSQLTSAVDKCINGIIACAVVFFFFSLVGLFGGYYLTRWLIRRNEAKCALWKRLCISALNILLLSLSVTLCAKFYDMWKPGGFIYAIVQMILAGIIALLDAYLLHGYKKVNLTNAVNFKNIVILNVAHAIILILAFAIFLIASLAINIIVGLFIGISLFEIALIVVGLNAEVYVKKLAEEKE